MRWGSPTQAKRGLEWGTVENKVSDRETRNSAVQKTGRRIPKFADLLIRWRVRHRFRATFSRQTRQVRKEATVTGSFVCSGRRCLAFFIGPSGDRAIVSS
jgi:hypothetical protein